MSMIFETLEIPDMPTDTEIPLATTRDEVRVEEVDAAESEAETDEEQLGFDEEASYEGVTEIEEAMVDSVVQISLADTATADPSGVRTVDVTLGTDAQYQSVVPGTDTPTDGATV
uniref:Polyprotein protein n=1 Tax=Solanum tuberosum TaxID=4113 RepID=M1DXP7_SOLTU